MKVLQINCVWKVGSTGKIMYDISECLKLHNASPIICYGRGERVNSSCVYKLSSELGAKYHSLLTLLFGVRFSHSFFATKKLFSIIKKEKPDVVHLHCLNCNFTNVYKLLEFLKLNNIPTVLTLHAEIMHTAGCDYALECEKWKTGCYACDRIKGIISSKFRDDSKHCFNLMKNSMSDFNSLVVVGVSEWLTNRAKLSPIFSKDTVFTTVNNGIDTESFNYKNSNELRKKLDIPQDKKIILYVTSNFNNPIKGSKNVLELANLIPDTQFIIVGFDGDKTTLPKNIIAVSKITDKEELAGFYSMADLTVLTSKKETFSVIVAESLCCGTPIVGFEAGGPEAIAIKEYSSFVEQGNVALLKNACEEFLSNKYDKAEISCKAKEKYNREQMCENYFELYKECIANKQRKVLQVNCVWKVGSTGKIMYDISEDVKENGMQSVVCYGRGQKLKEKNVYKVSSELGAKIHSLLATLFGVQFGHSFFATRKLISIIKKENPDVVHLHCLNANFTNVYKLLNFLKTNRIATVLTLHAEIMHTAGCAHAMECEKWKTGCHNCNKIGGKISKFFRDDAKHCYNLMKKAMADFENFTVAGVSNWTTERARLSSIFSSGTNFVTVGNGIDTNRFKFSETLDLRKRLNIPENKKVALHVTPNFNHAIKGGKYVLDLARQMPDVQFIIVGFNGDKNALPENVLPIVHTDSKEELAEYYSMADVTLLTSQRETFSLVVAESLSCGTPVVGFEAGAPETVAIEDYSVFVPYGDVENLKVACEEFLKKDFDKKKISAEATKKYAKEKMCQKYIEQYNTLISNKI